MLAQASGLGGAWKDSQSPDRGGTISIQYLALGARENDVASESAIARTVHEGY